MTRKINNKALDDLSWNILRELYYNARISTAEIGRRIGLSSPAVAERIQKMEEKGLITGYHTNVDLEKIGLVIQALISFSAKKIKHAGMVKLFDSMPEVMEWYSVTGNANMIIKIAATSSKELEAIIERLQEYGETSTSLILSASTDGRVMKKIAASPKI